MIPYSMHIYVNLNDAEIFTCGEEPPTSMRLPAVNNQCTDLKKDTCTANHNCVWCVAAAVPSACYSPEEAKRLPAAVFKCQFPPS